MKFIDYIEEEFSYNYTGTDDNMPDAFSNYLSDLQQYEIVELFNNYILSSNVDEENNKKYEDFVMDLFNNEQ